MLNKLIARLIAWLIMVSKMKGSSEIISKLIAKQPLLEMAELRAVHPQQAIQHQLRLIAHCRDHEFPAQLQAVYHQFTIQEQLCVYRRLQWRQRREAVHHLSQVR
jgi:hypothetical protein